MATGFETLEQIDRHYAQLRREAEAYRLLQDDATARLAQVRLPAKPRLHNLVRAVLAVLSTGHNRAPA
jgi:hypothetical protein